MCQEHSFWSSWVYSDTVRGTNLTKEVSLLWERKGSKPVDLSVRWLYSQPLSWRISNASLYFWKKWRWDCAAIISGVRAANLYVKGTIYTQRNKERDYKDCGSSGRAEQRQDTLASLPHPPHSSDKGHLPLSTPFTHLMEISLLHISWHISWNTWLLPCLLRLHSSVWDISWKDKKGVSAHCVHPLSEGVLIFCLATYKSIFWNKSWEQVEKSPFLFSS